MPYSARPPASLSRGNFSGACKSDGSPKRPRTTTRCRRMIRRRSVVRAIAGAALAVLLLALTVVIPISRQAETRITDANFERIEVGMSVPEVEAILGPATFWLKPALSASNDGPVVTQYGV